MLVIIDNQDSFTFNLYRYALELGIKTTVIDSLKNTYQDILNLKPSHLIISPGPGHPKDATLSLECLEKLEKDIPILGICLGHQCLAYQNGAKINQAKSILHGKTSIIFHHQKRLFKNIPTPYQVTRYHSLAIKSSTLSQDFAIDAMDNDNEIMAISHKTHPRFGVQFHPEAVLSEYGHLLLSNFLKIS